MAENINIISFTEEYKKATKTRKDELLKKIEIENYVPFMLKKEVVNTLIDSILENENGVLIYDPMMKHLYFTLTFISLYTNLEYGNDEGIISYDALVSNGLVDYIIKNVGYDYGDFVNLFEETLNYRININNSITNAIIKLIDSTVKEIEGIDKNLFNNLLLRITESGKNNGNNTTTETINK